MSIDAPQIELNEDDTDISIHAEPSPRSSAMERVVSALSTLPKVTFSTDDAYPNWQTIIHDNETIGFFKLESAHDVPTSPKEQWFRNISITNKDYLGGGFGMATYLSVIKSALEQGSAFRTAPLEQTESAKNVWEKLAKMGIATIVAPFEQTGTADENIPTYRGHYRINP